MKTMYSFSILTVIVVGAMWLSGCSDATTPPSPPASQTPDHSEETATHAGHEGHHDEHGHAEQGKPAEGHQHGTGGADKHGAGEGHAHGGNAADMQARVEKLASYGEAMEHIGRLRDHIAELIAANQLSDVHPPAQEISMAAKRLAELASKSNIPREDWKAINTQSRDLANLFAEIDRAADAGMKVETEVAFGKMKDLIDGLAAFKPKSE